MQKLRCAFKVVDNLLLMKVVEQPDSFPLRGVFGSGDFLLERGNDPNHRMTYLWARGTNKTSLLGFRTGACDCKSREEAERFCLGFKALIHAYNKSRQNESPLFELDDWEVAE